MKKISLQWRLTCIITLYIAVICGCLTLLVYKNGIYYIDSLQETVDARGDDAGDQGGDGTADGSDQIYISIPEDKWDEFARDFSVQVYNNKADYKRNSLILSALLALLGGVATYFISGHALRPIREFSEKIEEVQAQNLADSRIEENKVKELNQLRISYNNVTFLVFLYLLLQRIYGIVHRLLETFAAGLRHQVVAGNLYPDNGHLVTFLVVLVEFEDDIGPCRTLYETVEFSHFCLYEFDELPVGIEFNCLNLYVHN